MGKTRDLFKKIRDTKRTFHAKIGTIKDRNSRDLTERRYQEEVARTQKKYTKNLHDLDNHDDIITHLEHR